MNSWLREIDEKASIMLHHDAITATSPTATLNDYMNWVWEVEKLVEEEETKVSQVYTSNLWPNSNNEILKGLHHIEVYNPFPHFRFWVVNFTISTPYVKIYD